MGESLDFEAIRHRVKLLQDTGETLIFENRDGVTCPVCGDPFDEALATTGRSEQLAPSRKLDVCLLREQDRLVVFTHA